ncbi:MAG: polysaccharide deacetylase family protein [Natronomonas sp.]|uniref:polysaccharide deacetylase family protein n=1 Tax=Natronomonas sp. TaxID=2184060 RepID=UPI00286FCA72|nr:polysaccharide deacetylase family protein [Natronomonas sp.]MDR9429927.1 polysaccharide deacetylase family protein [Natronomonas sp.]
MREAETPTLREFETWLSLFSDGPIPEEHRWRAWFCVAEYELDDFEALSETLTNNDASGSFAFLGRDADEQAAIIETLDADSHEIAFHSHRHHTYADLSYDDAHDAIATGMTAIENATGITPDGFFVPFLTVSEGAVTAIEEIGFEWMLGRPERDPAGVEVLDPVTPFDTRRLERHDPEEALTQLQAEAEAGDAPFLFHPPVVEYHDGLEAFEEWIETVRPVTVAGQLASGGTGVVLDCVRPVRIQ